MQFSRIRKAIWLLCLVGVALYNAAAQQSTATLTGIVTDNSGAIVQDAQIIATNQGTNLALTGKTNAQGEYRIDLLPVGTYSLQIVAKGYKTYVQSGLVLSLGQFATVNAKLEIGGTMETVTVTTEAPMLNLTNATVGATVENQEIENLPIVNRNVYDLLSLVPGVQTNTTTFTVGFPQQTVLINGGVSIANSGSTSYYLDGSTNMTGLRNTGNVQPNPDAIDQFRVETNNYSAEYGRFPNGVVRVITKSGTNNFHGSLFEFWRETALNAKDYLSPDATPLHRHQFGGAVGGPIAKDKTFFFFSYGGLRQITTQFFNSGIVPTVAQRKGDFSANLPTSSGTITSCSQSLSAADKAAGNFIVCNPTTRKPFAGNLIPSSFLDPTVQNLLNTADTTLPHIPLPNAPGNIAQGYLTLPYNTDEFLLKIDQNWSPSHRFTGEVFETAGTNNLNPGGNLAWSKEKYFYRQWNAVLSDIYTFNSNWVNQFWLSYTRDMGGRLDTPAHAIGEYGSAFKVQGVPALPNINVSGYFNAGQAIAGPRAGSNYYEIRDVVLWNHGPHSFTFGGDVGLNKDTLESLLNNYGIFAFAGSTSARTGNALSDFITGRLNTLNQDAPSLAHTNSWYTGLFFQDDYRIHPRLTLNLGIRWDVQTPPVETNNMEQNFIKGQQSTVIPTAPLGLVTVGDKGVPRGVIPVRWSHVSPRVGFAWDMFGNSKTSVRGGVGLFWGSISGNEWATTGEPFTLREKFTNVNTVTDPYGSTPNPFPYYYNPKSPIFTYPFSVPQTSPDFNWTSTYQANLAVEQQWTPSFATSVGYVGSLGRHLPTTTDSNYPVFATSQNPVTGPNGTIITTSTSKNVDDRRPYMPGIYQSINTFDSNQTSAYHALQVTASEHLGKRLTLRSYYVWAKNWESIGMESSNSSYEDPHALYLERGRADNDYRHYFVTSFVWLLDYYRQDHAALRTALNGWQVSPIITLHSGQPFTVTTGVDNNLDGNTNDRPIVLKNASLDPHRSRTAVMTQWFDPSTSAFASPATGTDGTASRNLLEGPGYKNVNMAIFRNFHFLESYSLQFRGEFSNIFNMVSLSNPNANLSSPNAGKITGAHDMRQTQLGLRLTF